MNFNNPYSRAEYLDFFQNHFLTDDFKISEEKLSFEFKPNYLKSAFIIGEDKSLDLKVFEALHESENDPRVGLSKDIFRLMSSYGYKRALVLLHSSKSENYRLSLATIELSLNESKVKKKYSNPRRYSFFLGPDAKVKTPQNFLISKGRVKDFEDLLSRFSVEVVTKQFYEEIANWYFWALNNVEFPYDDETDKEQINAKNLIRLITRVIFIWFMKQKNLIPNHLFDKKFVDNILNSTDKTGSNYYKAILQNLFFATLNTPMKKDQTEKETRGRIFVDEAQKQGYVSDGYMQHGFFRYRRFIKDVNKFLETFENIPFLNGGLFDCLDKKIDVKEIRIDCFSDNPKNETKLKVPDALFFLEDEIEVDLSKYFENGKNKKVTGLFAILNKYNFTINENTPIDQEIALDPELLGKVFENLLAAYVPETATTARKKTGSYYTPREIVDYMVDESLKEFLKTQIPEIDDDKLNNLFSYESDENPFVNDNEISLRIIDTIENLKILDPACGSGAFPMGILHKLVLVLHKLDPENKIWKEKLIEKVPAELREETRLSLENKSLDYIRKLGLIEHCIYGVDIQEIAVQISKLRFFISLLVEQIPDDSKPNRDIKSLPNLETKFVAANTLIKLDKPQQFSLTSKEVNKLEEELFKVREEIFYANSRSEKLKLQKKEKELREKLKEALKKSGFESKVAEQITSWDPFDQNTHSDWFDPEWMFGVKVPSSSLMKEANEGFDIVIGNPPYVSTKGVTEVDKKNLEKQFGFADDLYAHFIFKGFDLLKPNGIISYITSKTYWTIQTKKNVRGLLLNNKIIEIFDTASPFAAMVDTAVFIAQKQQRTENYIFTFKDGKNDLSNPIVYQAEIEWYRNIPNNVFFIPTEKNIKIQQKYGRIVKDLLDKWWDKISTSKNIEKYKIALEKYRNSLKPGNITLLGLITEGGVGIQTGNNGKYIGVLEGTKWANKVKEERPKKLWDFIQAKNPNELAAIKTLQQAKDFITSQSETQIRELFDTLKENYGRDIFGQGWLYRIVSHDEIADVETLTEDEKLNGISGIKTFVPYDKGDKDGNRWYAPTPYYIEWSKENVKILQTDPKARWQGYQFYFREGFCWTFTLNEFSEYFKARLRLKSIFDVNAMSLFSLIIKIPEFYFVSILNSYIIFDFKKTFINSSSGFQINDARQLPIIIPTSEQLATFKNIFNRAVSVQKQKFAGKMSEKEAEKELAEIQKELDKQVEELYGV